MKFRLTGQYGELSPVRNWQSHSGIDFGMPEGTTLRAVKEGVVRLADYGNQNAGKTVLIDSPDGHTYIYGHLHDFVAKNGQHVNVGDVIAHSGNTGHSTSEHLHFGMKDTATGQFQDPTHLAEKVSNYAGNDFTLTPSPFGTGIIPHILGWSGEAVKEKAKELTIDILSGVGEAIVELLAGVTLVGAGVLILLKVCGYRDGGRWAGVLIGVNVLLKFLGVRS
jgi:murein DD-endopeptidase MepM/ murein hydrolase activator NlpD